MAMHYSFRHTDRIVSYPRSNTFTIPQCLQDNVKFPKQDSQAISLPAPVQTKHQLLPRLLQISVTRGPYNPLSYCLISCLPVFIYSVPVCLKYTPFSFQL